MEDWEGVTLGEGLTDEDAMGAELRGAQLIDDF